MQKPKRYSRSPIAEAIIDLRVSLPETVSLEIFQEIHTHIQQDFPVIQPCYKGVGAVFYEPGVNFTVDTSERQIGLWFRSEDNLQVFQSTLEGFTFNHLAPYTSWSEIRATARHLWNIYKELCQPLFVVRAAIRYINQLHIPTKEAIELKDYLRTLPEISPDLPQSSLQNFFIQLQIPQPDLDCMLVINEAIAPRLSPEEMTVIFDLDLFRQHIWESDDEDIWLSLDRLRRRKNEVFEASITDKIRELID